MSYEDVRSHFLGYYEKRIKIQLLRAELDNIVRAAKGMKIDGPKTKDYFPIDDFDLTVLDTVLSDVYTILADNVVLLSDLTQLRNGCRATNRRQGLYQLELATARTQRKRQNLTKNLNNFLQEELETILSFGEESLQLLKRFA